MVRLMVCRNGSVRIASDKPVLSRFPVPIPCSDRAACSTTSSQICRRAACNPSSSAVSKLSIDKRGGRNIYYHRKSRIAKRWIVIQKAEFSKIGLKSAAIENDLLRKTHNVYSITVSSNWSYIRRQGVRGV